MGSKPAWMTEEEERADKLTDTEATTNNTAPKLVKVNRAPARKQKAFYIQAQHADAFEDLAFKLKKQGIKAPELAEQAIELLLKQHGEKL